MFKQVAVLVVFFATVFARPGYLESYPAAVSHVSRVDVHAKPLVTAYATPYYPSSIGYGGYGLGGYGEHGYGSGYGGAYSTGYSSGVGHEIGHGIGHGIGLGYGHGYPLAQSYSNRVDIHDAAVPVVASIGHGGHYAGYGYGGWDY